MTLTSLAIGSVLTLSATPLQGLAAPRGAMRVPMLTVTAQVPCSAADPVQLSALRVRHEGRGDVSDIDGVYVLEGGVRRSRAQSFDRRSSEATLRLRGVEVAPCAARTLTVAVSFSPAAAAGSEHRLTLLGGTSPDGALSPVPLPRASQQHTRVVPLDVDPPVLRMLERTRRLTYGTERTLARFLVTAGADDLALEAVTFTNGGSAKDADLQNLRVVNAKGDTLSAVAPSLQGKTVRLTFEPPLIVERSNERLLEVRGDVQASVRRTVRLAVEEDSDLVWAVVRGRR